MQSPTPDDLLKHAGFLRALAFRLVGDHARADDLVQDAYVAALESPPRRAVRAWLGAVVRNLAGKVRRSESRRIRREHAVSRTEPLPGTDEIAARIALHRSLVQAVDALEEPYRSIVVLRFFYDLPPRDVAERLGVPVETVRTRTRRALEILRGRIDRNALALALLPLPALKSATGSALTWGILMATKRRVVLALALLVLISGSTLVLIRSGHAGAARAHELPLATAASANATTDGAPTTGPGSTGAEDNNPNVLVRGLVLLDGEPVAGAQVTLRDPPPEPPLFDVSTQWYLQMAAPLPKPLDEARTDAEGRFELRCTERAAVVVATLAADAVPERRMAHTPLPGDLVIRLRRGAGILGLVVDEGGAPVPGAIVRWRLSEGWAPYLGGDTSTDADGRFRAPDGAKILVLAPGFAPAIAGAEGAARIVLTRGGRVVGVVRDARGASVPDAAVLLATSSAPGLARTDTSGRYEMRLAEGHLVHAVVMAPGRPPVGSWTDELALPPRPVVAGKDLTFDITLPAAAALRGTVVHGDAPVAQAEVTLVRSTTRWPVVVAVAASDAGGAFAIDSVPAGAYEIRARATGLVGKADASVVEGAEPDAVTVPVTEAGRVVGTVVGGLPVERVVLEAGGQAVVDAFGCFVFDQVAPVEATRVTASPCIVSSETFAVRPGETVRVTLDTSTARLLRGRAVFAGGAPASGALAALVGKRSYEHSAVDLSEMRETGVTADGDGRFVMPVPEEPTILAVYHPDGAPARVTKVDPDAGELEIVLQPGRVISGRVVWPGGEPVRGVLIRATAEAGRDVMADIWWMALRDGEFELRGLGEGRARIEVRHPDGFAHPIVVETGTRDVVIELRRTQSIRGAVVDRSGRPVSAAQITAKAPGKPDVVGYSTHVGRFEIRQLDDAVYDLYLGPGTRSDWYPPKLTPFLPTVVRGVAAGTADVVVEVDTGRDVSGVVLGPEGEPVANAIVAALGSGEGMAPMARTAKNGAFTLTGITDGHKDVLVVASGFPPRAAPIGDGATEIHLERGESVRVRVLAPDGNPVGGTWVAASAATPAIVERVEEWRRRLGTAASRVSGLSYGHAQTDADGRAEVRGLAPGDYRIAPLKAAGGISPEVPARTAGPEVTVQLERALSIAGTVGDRDGNRVGSVKGEYWVLVVAYRDDRQVGYAVVDSDGAFTIEDLTAGPVRLEIGYSGVPPAFHGEARAEAGATAVRVVATRY